MAIAYLQAAEARSKLIKSGKFNELTAPGLADLEEVLEIIEIRLDSWLLYRAAPTDYVEIYKITDSGVVNLSNYPVLSVSSIVIKSILQGQTDQAIPTSSMKSVWQSGRTLSFGIPNRPTFQFQLQPGAPGILPFRNANATLEVQYRAGLDPLPREFKLVVFSILMKALQESGLSGDLSFLDTPTRDVSSLSVPGGLSKSYQLGKPSGAGGGGSEGDRLMGLISQYRRMYFT